MYPNQDFDIIGTCSFYSEALYTSTILRVWGAHVHYLHYVIGSYQLPLNFPKVYLHRSTNKWLASHWTWSTFGAHCYVILETLMLVKIQSTNDAWFISHNNQFCACSSASHCFCMFMEFLRWYYGTDSIVFMNLRIYIVVCIMLQAAINDYFLMFPRFIGVDPQISGTLPSELGKLSSLQKL